jgi:hypothetical protein
VPYRDPVSRAKFEGTPDQRAVRTDYRGYAPARPEPVPLKSPPQRTVATQPAAPRPQVVERSMPAPAAAPTPSYEVRRPVAPAPRPPEMVRPAPAVVERPMAPAMESFGHGPQVNVQEQRGFVSRESAPSVSFRGGGHR